MIKKIKDYIVETIKEEYKFIIIMLLLFGILNYPLNYYITIGGGISSASSRIMVDQAYKSKGSFNISYVKQVDANVLFYGMSYLIPTWERESADLYKYEITESMEDIAFRSELDLKTANGTATYWAYTLANKEVKEISSKQYVIAKMSQEYPNDIKVGDEILSTDDQTFDTIREYKDYIQTKEIGDTIDIKVRRNDKELVLPSEVYESEEEKVIGVYLQYVKEYETDPKLTVKFNASESGPSGGLVTTLEMYNQLTKKDLTKGKTIAGTGTIEEDGSIGEIGGIEHKILGAAKAKADVFLCPGGDNYKDAKKYIKEKKLKIKLIKVDTIEDAIKKLEELA